MYQIYLGFCVILSLFNEGSALKVYKEGEVVKVNCDTEKSGSLTFWFKINSLGAKYIFTLRNKEPKTIVDESKYVVDVNDKVTLAIQNFQKKADSGLYTCATLNNNQLFFGKPSEIKGEPEMITTPPKLTTTPKPITETTTKSRCNCKKTEIKTPAVIFNCETWILSSLASGCAFLLILLIFTILYCNRLRTRRCPHHYKRQPQSRPAGHPKLPNTHF